MHADASNCIVSVVIPCFDEAARIGPTLDDLVAHLGRAVASWEIVVVDDGSRDDTAGVVADRFAQEPRVRVLRFAPNHGKGFAVRAGVAASRGELILVTDADLATPVTELDGFLAEAAGGADLVVASRVAPGARVLTPQPLRRRLAGTVFRTLVQALGLTAVRDTQCGFKLLRRATVGPLVARLDCTGFAFDVELLVRAARAGLVVVERPVAWRDVPGSKLRLWPDAFRLARDVVRMRGRLG